MAQMRELFRADEHHYMVNPSITIYPDVRKKSFYKVESAVGAKSFVTARDWDDPSQMIYLYEQHKITVDRKSAFGLMIEG